MIIHFFLLNVLSLNDGVVTKVADILTLEEKLRVAQGGTDTSVIQ
jgi:hypothetical protein